MDWWPLCTSCWAARLASPVFHLDGQTAGWCYCCAGAASQAQVTAAGTSRVLTTPVGDRMIVGRPRLRLRGGSYLPTPPSPAAPLKDLRQQDSSDGVWQRPLDCSLLFRRPPSDDDHPSAKLQGRDERRHCVWFRHEPGNRRNISAPCPTCSKDPVHSLLVISRLWWRSPVCGTALFNQWCRPEIPAVSERTCDVNSRRRLRRGEPAHPP